MFKKISPYQLKELALPVLALIFFCLLSVFFLLPKGKQVLETRKKIRQQEEQIAKLKEKLSDLNAFSEQELNQSANLLLLALPAENDFYFFLAKVIRTFETEGITLDSFKLSPGLISSSSAEQKEKNFSIKIVFSASFDRVRAVVDRLEDTLPIVAVNSLKMASSGTVATDSAEGAALPMEMDILCFFSPLPKVLGKIDSPLPKMTAQKKELLEQIRQKEILGALVEIPEVQATGAGRENPFSEW